MNDIMNISSNYASWLHHGTCHHAKSDRCFKGGEALAKDAFREDHASGSEECGGAGDRQAG